MKLKKHIILFCLMAVIELAYSNLFSQETQTKPTRQSSFEAFSQGNYEKAYTQFRELLKTYSKDPLYKYYSGVCLIKLNKDPGEAVNLLQQSLQTTGAVKTLPSDGLFYLGRAQQMTGKYSEAALSYDQFTRQAGKKAARELGVPEFIQQCNLKKGQIADSEIKPVEILKTDKTDSTKVEVKPLIKESDQKTIGKESSAKVILPLSYDKILSEAIAFQFKADSVLAVVDKQKNDLGKVTASEKPALRARIADNEKLAAFFQKSADQKYREAQALNPSQDSSKYPKVTTKQPESPPTRDTTLKIENRIVNFAGNKPDIIKPVIPVVKPQVETFAFFEVLTKPKADQNEKISVDPVIPEGLIYRIQIAVFRNPVAPAFFKGMSPVYGFKIAGTDKTGYYVGMFRRFTDATKALASVKTRGFKDAFIVGLSGGKSVSPDRAALLEKEWGKKPFVSSGKTLPENKSDTIPPTLSFRVEVTRSVKPLKDDIVEGMRKMAGNRGLDIQPVDDGKIAYLIGKFITFETAAEYSDLLNRNGYREAHVVAWMGKKEISIDAAKQLREKLK